MLLLFPLSLEILTYLTHHGIAALSSTDHSNRLTAYTNNGQSLRELGNLSDSLDNFRKALLFTDLKKINELDVWLLNCMIAVMSISTTWKDYEQIEQLVLKNFASTEGLEPESRIDLYTFGLQRYASLAQSLQAAKLACPFFPMELQNQEQEYAREHSSSSSSSSSRNTTIRIGTIYRHIGHFSLTDTYIFGPFTMVLTCLQDISVMTGEITLWGG